MIREIRSRAFLVGILAVCAGFQTGCVFLVNYRPTYLGERVEGTTKPVKVTIRAETSDEKIVPALIVVWLALYRQPYETNLTFRGPADDFWAARVDSLEIVTSAPEGPKIILPHPPRWTKEVRSKKWVDARMPDLDEGPEWGIVLLGWWWPLPVPRYPLGWLRKQPDYKEATIGPFAWDLAGKRATSVRMKIEYTIRTRSGERSGCLEIPLKRRNRLFVVVAPLMA